jgi:phage gpG-like protein
MALIRLNDGISPDLRRRAAVVRDKRPLLEAMGQSIKSLGVQAFTDPAKRAQAWAPRQDDLPHALLQKSTMLRKSLRVLGFGRDSVQIGSDRPYATTHQLGDPDRNIPARPYLPFYKNGQMTQLGRQRSERALLAALRSRGF